VIVQFQRLKLVIVVKVKPKKVLFSVIVNFILGAMSRSCLMNCDTNLQQTLAVEAPFQRRGGCWVCALC